jgi:hypothetical protein
LRPLSVPISSGLSLGAIAAPSLAWMDQAS